MKLILASASPRRAELLASAGFAFEVIPADIDECEKENESPEKCVKRLATAKARKISEGYPEAMVLAADTVVVLDGVCLGKPADAWEAKHMLRTLSGRSHEVLTGFTLCGPGWEETDLCRTIVEFRGLAEEEIATYVESGEPMDKAGAYGIQAGAAHMIRRIDGSYTNVVGLPMAEVVSSLLRKTEHRL